MILLIDKPAWRTSHDVVKYVKIHGWFKKVWHAGTLDPAATGLLIILTDEDTKQMAILVWHDKTYTATIDLSHKSDTRDADYHDYYEQVAIQEAPTIEQIQGVLQSFVPKAALPIPSFSAKKRDGKRMYENARKWVVYDETKEMIIHEIEVLDYAFPYVHIRCAVGSGTFIRSIAFALGEQLWTWWILSALRRESSWEYSLSSPGCIQDLTTTQDLAKRSIPEMPMAESTEGLADTSQKA